MTNSMNKNVNLMPTPAADQQTKDFLKKLQSLDLIEELKRNEPMPTITHASSMLSMGKTNSILP